MKLVPIFENNILSITFSETDDEEHNRSNCEFELLFENWNDPEWLENFFESNKSDLKEFNMTVEEAVEFVLKEAERIENRLVDLAESVDEELDLDSMFKPLENQDYQEKPLKKVKAYGTQKPNILRIYAVKIDDDCYVITGGAIKLTARMEERKHTKDELAKLNKCRDYLKENGIDNFDLIIELNL